LAIRLMLQPPSSGWWARLAEIARPFLGQAALSPTLHPVDLS
jgi:hypothetical protein